MANLERAIQLAAMYHAGQKDKMGKAYILHPLRVMSSLGLDTTDTHRIVAVLHDIIEDTEITAERLLAEGFTAEQVDAICLLTKTEDYNEDEYFRKIMHNPIARAVKIKDLEDNMDFRRIINKEDLGEKDLARMKNTIKDTIN